MSSQKPLPTNEEGCYCKLYFRLTSGDREYSGLSYLTFAPGRFRIQTIDKKEGIKSKKPIGVDFSYIAIQLPRWLRKINRWLSIGALNHIEVTKCDVECIQESPCHLVRLKRPFSPECVLELEITDPSFRWSNFSRVVFMEDMFTQRNKS